MPEDWSSLRCFDRADATRERGQDLGCVVPFPSPSNYLTRRGNFYDLERRRPDKLKGGHDLTEAES